VLVAEDDVSSSATLAKRSEAPYPSTRKMGLMAICRMPRTDAVALAAVKSQGHLDCFKDAVINGWRRPAHQGLKTRTRMHVDGHEACFAEIGIFR